MRNSLALSLAASALFAATTGCSLASGPTSYEAPIPTPTCAAGAIGSEAGGVSALGPLPKGVVFQTENADTQAQSIVQSSATGVFTTLYDVPSSVRLEGLVGSDASSTLAIVSSSTSSAKSLESISFEGDGASKTLYATPSNQLESAVSDGATVYVTDGAAIFALPVSGGAPHEIYATKNLVTQLALDGSTLYWVEQLPQSLDGAILSAPVSSALQPTQVVPSGAFAVTSWGAQGGVFAATVLESDGVTTALETKQPGGALTILDHATPNPESTVLPTLFLRDGVAYYTLDSVTLRKAPLDGSSAPVTLGSSVSGVESLAVDGTGDLYFATAKCLYRAE